MKYELAKELKDAGFPQFWNDRHWFYSERTLPPTLWCINALEQSEHIPHNADAEATWPVACPTLSELIEACGDEFVSLRNFRREVESFHGKGKATDLVIEQNYGGLKRGDWIAECSRTTTADEGTVGRISTDGYTPEEAIARLWIALNKEI